MKIWVITSGEPLPTHKGGERLLRSGNLCIHLAEASHNVSWWTSTFDHLRKIQVPEDDQQYLKHEKNIQFIFSPGYTKNISLRRLIDHLILGIQFRKMALSCKEKPDVIWCSYPSIETAIAAISVARKMNVPVVVDVRDLWPDVFLEVAPKWARPLLKLFLIPYTKASEYIFSKSDAIVAITDSYLKWAQERGKRRKNTQDKVFAMGYPDFDLEQNDYIEAKKFWQNLNIDSHTFNICFFGTLGKHFDINTVIEAAQLMEKRDKSVKFILCGRGSSLEEYRKKTQDLTNIIFPGHVNKAGIKTLMDMSHIGIAPYKNTENFQRNIPNKIYEYAAGALATLSGVDGEVAKFITHHDIGHCYPSGDSEALVNIIIQLKKQKKSLLEQGNKARMLFEKQFDSKIISKQIEGFLTNLVQNRKQK